MTIEFSCPQCAKILKTHDDKAGVEAKCPGCGTKITVPSPGIAPSGAGDSDDYGLSPRASSSASGTMSCPMCGERIASDALQCEFCGEALTSQAARGMHRFVPSAMDASETLGLSWRIYRSRNGLCFGVFILQLAIILLAGVPAELADNGVFGDNLRSLKSPLSLLGTVVNSFLVIGQLIIYLKVARQEPTEISELFSGGKYLLRVWGASLVYGFLFIVGFICLIVPAIYVWLVLWPCILMVVDQDVGVFESISRAYEVGKINKLQTFILFILMFFLAVAGFLAACVGLLYVLPLITMMQVVAYLQMTGQTPPEPAAS